MLQQTEWIFLILPCSGLDVLTVKLNSHTPMKKQGLVFYRFILGKWMSGKCIFCIKWCKKKKKKKIVCARNAYIYYGLTQGHKNRASNSLCWQLVYQTSLLTHTLWHVFCIVYYPSRYGKQIAPKWNLGIRCVPNCPSL